MHWLSIELINCPLPRKLLLIGKMKSEPLLYLKINKKPRVMRGFDTPCGGLNTSACDYAKHRCRRTDRSLAFLLLFDYKTSSCRIALLWFSKIERDAIRLSNILTQNTHDSIPLLIFTLNYDILVYFAFIR
jgi:hypothetical protein